MTSMGPLDIPIRKKSAELYLHDYDLDDDLSIASPPVSKNMVDVDDPVDALSSNREQTHLVAAGCRGVVNDMSVHIWDIRRPFLPYASFEDHSDSVTGMLDQLDLHTAIAGVKKYSWIKRINQRSLEDSSESETSDSESNEPEELQPWQRNMTLPIERDLLEVSLIVW
ncbi:hypothetical protein Aduo_007822 [Ancylostoma duodenale]